MVAGGPGGTALHSAAVAAFNAIRKVEADHREAIETAEQLKAEREMALRRAAEGKATSPEAEKLSNVGEWMADLFR